jgi:hypothetical protein
MSGSEKDKANACGETCPHEKVNNTHPDFTIFGTRRKIFAVRAEPHTSNIKVSGHPSYAIVNETAMLTRQGRRARDWGRQCGANVAK